MSSNDSPANVKDAGREGRLSFRKFAEHQLRNEFKREAMEKCDVQLSAFADCAKIEGVLVVFKCREFQSAVNECMAVYNSKERWEMYKIEHEADLENKVPMMKKK
jgi:hypothetical protein